METDPRDREKFEEITAAELLASKFVPVIEKTTCNDLTEKIKKGEMSVEEKETQKKKLTRHRKRNKNQTCR